MVWSVDELFHARIAFDVEFWESESVKARAFHRNVIVPELLAKFFTNEHIRLEVWCECGQVDDGRLMVRCDNDDCHIKWYHLECLGMDDIPSTVWFCSNCAVEQ